MKKRTINGKVYVITPREQEGTCFGCAFDGHFNEAPVCPYMQSECKNGMIFKALETEKTKKSNLKPFNLEEAKAGKSVYTRDGHKARIICFDRKFYHDGYNYPIVAMVNDNDNELVHAYTQDGLLIGNMEGELDLMMLSEKKEGWVNVYKGTEEITFSEHPYPSKEKAINSACIMFNRIDTVKICWEE